MAQRDVSRTIWYRICHCVEKHTVCVEGDRSWGPVEAVFMECSGGVEGEGVHLERAGVRGVETRGGRLRRLQDKI